MIKNNYSFKSSYNNSSFQNSKVIKYYFFIFFDKIFYFMLLILSILIINFTKTISPIETNIREKVIFLAAPLYTIAELPFNLSFDFVNSIKNILLTNSINRDLTEQNILLKKLYLESKDIKAENENLKSLLNFKDEIKNDYDYITSRVYYNTKNGINKEFIANVSVKDKIVEGSLVFGVNRSVVGRVINVGEKYSNILLLNDINSRIPARTASTKERIILSGTNKSYLEISYFNSKIPNIIDGDLVFTSGDSDLMPDGFFIGKIKKTEDGFVVDMNEKSSNLFNIMILINK